MARFPLLLTLSVTILVLFLLSLSITLVHRAAFPFDLLIWSESPFMTNIIKLRHHDAIFTPASEANSFIYTGTQEYFYYFIANFLNLNVEIQTFRAISFVQALVSCFFLSLSMTVLREAHSGGEGRVRTLEFGLFFLASMLLNARNFTSDVPHPDNINLLHFSILLLLTLKAAQRQSLILALVATVFGSLGFLAKQTSALAAVAPLVTLGWIFRRQPQRIVSLLAVAVVATAACLFWFSRSEHAWHWAVDLPARHGVHPTKIVPAFKFFLSWPSLPLTVVTGLALGLVAVRARTPGKVRVPLPLHFAWFAVGAFSALPSFAGHLKTAGSWNNLMITEIWMLVLALPIVVAEIQRSDPPRSERADAVTTRRARTFTHPLKWLLCVGFAAFVVSLMPTKRAPDQRHMEFGQILTAKIRDDLLAGRTVLLSHGTMPLLMAGFEGVPLDRSNSVLELGMAGQADRARTLGRIRAQSYDRIYLIAWWWYGPEIGEALKSRYKVVEIIPGAPTFDDYSSGYQKWLMGEALILEPRAGHERSLRPPSETEKSLDIPWLDLLEGRSKE